MVLAQRWERLVQLGGSESLSVHCTQASARRIEGREGTLLEAVSDARRCGSIVGWSMCERLDVTMR